MLLKTFKLKKIYFIIIIFILILIVLLIFLYTSVFGNESTVVSNDNYIKWIDFNATEQVLKDTSNLDIKSHNENYEIKYNWIELLSYLSSKYYGHLDSYKKVDLDTLIDELNSGKSMQELSQNMSNYNYYYESYSAVLGNFIGEYEIKNNETGTYEKKYGLKVFSPIAKGYSYSHYDDFGNSRNYGYKRVHLGNDLMGSIGTPIIAIESGYVEACGWNQYGGWRIGIRSFDGLRYYYYAHLKKDHPYNSEIVEGSIVTAGDVIGYLGMTGYSNKENVNNINVPHLHFGLQIIFDPVQKDGINQIWIDVYQLINFLRQNSSAVYYDKENKEYYRKTDMIEYID